MSSPLPQGDRYEARFPARLRASWEARFKSEPAEKMRLTRHRLEKFGEEHFGPLDDKTVEKARAVTADVLAVPAASLEELDLGRLLAMLYYSETEEAKAVREAVLRVGVAPPSVPGASGSVQEQLRQMILQQQQQVQAQQQQQQHMVVMLQQMQQQVQALQAQVSQPDLQQQARGQPAAQAADPAPLQGAPAVAESEMPMMQLDAKPVIAGYPEDAADVRGWEEAMATDVAGLVRDLRLKYVSGAQSESLTDSFRRLRDWINGVAQGGGWVYNPEIVRLGNDLLQEVRLHHYWCTKQLPRAQIMRELAQASDDPMVKAAARVEASMAKKGKWDARPRGGGKGGKKGFTWGQGNAKPGGK
ncbi:hypothetical protein DIPPA_34487 [Diplonema papillatum]|nr:hypothetical protein DIPPA_04387 [Diplonema papillatum]KAJ9443119.1 hypothetical protein DIPPA_26764 [Diplonema papillatum]KAJ9468058.1 hypothetical protein DIPPA_34487 [Diplonema papillatum]